MAKKYTDLREDRMANSSITDKFFEEQTEKSAIKSAIVSDFFKVYLRIISFRFKNEDIYYIDLFSGPGRYENNMQHNALELDIKASSSVPVLLVNKGYWGINAVQGRTYRLSFWAKTLNYKGTLKAMLASEKGVQPYAEIVISEFASGKAKGWTKYEATFTANDNDPQAQFIFVFDGVGQVQLDMVSLFPPTFKNRENGMRPDLANMLWQMHPKFMRFPGGCFVEGQESPDNAFRWERTIGPIEEREGHWNVNWGYRTTDGLGYHEYLQLAEDLGAKPLFVVNVGLWHGGMTPYDSIQP